MRDEDSVIIAPDPTRRETACHLGFATVEEYQEWEDAGCPVGRCGSWKCGRPSFWPELHPTCKHCGCGVVIEYMVRQLEVV